MDDDHAWFITSDQPQHEKLALFLTVLCENEYQRHDSTLDSRFAAISGYVLRSRAVLDEAFANELQLMRPSHVFVSQDVVLRTEKRLRDLLQKRLWAGWLANQLLKKCLDSPLPLPKGVLRPTKAALAEHAARASGISSGSNFLSRSYRPSLTVIHLCMAVELLGATLLATGEDDTVFDKLIREPELLRATLKSAENLESQVIECVELDVNAGSLVKIRMES